MTNPIKVSELFSEDEIQALKQTINELPPSVLKQHQDLGRVEVGLKEAPYTFADKLNTLVNSLSEEKLEINWPPLYVEYSAKYGEPNLRPHFDGDYNELIIDYQLESNTPWPIGVNLELYPLQDNEATIFNPNTNIHWRPRKDFQSGEYVRMLFFRFFKSTGKSDYSYLPHHPDDPIFKEVSDFRDSLGAI